MAKRKKAVKMNLLDRITGWLLVVGGLVHGLQAFEVFPLEGLGIAGNIIKGVVGFSSVYFIYRIALRFE